MRQLQHEALCWMTLYLTRVFRLYHILFASVSMLLSK